MIQQSGSTDYLDQGYVYVLTNEAMPGLVKIGVTRASDPQSRVSSLYNTSVPLPFDLHYAGLVTNARKVELALHNAFDYKRINPNRAFFEIEPDQAKGILELIAIEDFTERTRDEADEGIDDVDKRARERLKKKRRPRLDFDQLGIGPGTVLTFVEHEEAKVEARLPKKVVLVSYPDGYVGIGTDGEYVSLTPLTRDLREFVWGSAAIHPPAGFWLLPDGRTLADAYREVHGPPR